MANAFRSTAVVAFTVATVGVSEADLTQDRLQVQPPPSRPIEGMTVCEHMGFAWQRQLVRLSLPGDQGGLSHRVVMLEADGRHAIGQVIPYISSDGIVSPDSQEVVTIIDIAPEEQLNFKIIEQPNGGAEATSELSVRAGDGFHEVSTELFGIRLLSGEATFETPHEPDDVPGPVHGLRDQTGKWYGSSKLYGSSRIRGYRSRLIDTGPVLARIRIDYQYEDGTNLALLFSFVAGDGRVRCRSWTSTSDSQLDAANTALSNGWRLHLQEIDSDATLWIPTETLGNRWEEPDFPRDEDSGLIKVRLDRLGAGVIAALTPWDGWWDQERRTKLQMTWSNDRVTFFIAALDAGAWVAPAAINQVSMPFNHPAMKASRVHMLKRPHGQLYLEFPRTPGMRAWQMGTTEGPVQYDFDIMRDYILDWPSGSTHPQLFISADALRHIQNNLSPALQRLRASLRAQAAPFDPTRPDNNSATALAAWLLSGDTTTAIQLGLVARLNHYLEYMGPRDNMRLSTRIVAMYDALIDSGLLNDHQRRIVRARFAYFVYRLAAAEMWSNQRGFAAGHLNMRLVNELNVGLAAAAIVDHPMAKSWGERSVNTMEWALAKCVGPSGEWPESITHYARVSLSMLVTFAIASKNAGWHDYTADPRLKRAVLFQAKQDTPSDPRWGGQRQPGWRATPPSGRGWAGVRDGLFGVTATAIENADPDLAETLHWAWAQEGKPYHLPDQRMGGFEYVFIRPETHASPPAWTSERFPQTGVVLRHHFATAHEWYINLVVTASDDWTPSESGGLASVFAHGKPIISVPSGAYAEREEVFLNRVVPASRRDSEQARRKHASHFGPRRIVEFTTLPWLDYVRTEITVGRPAGDIPVQQLAELPRWPDFQVQSDDVELAWQRCLLFVKDPDPTQLSYLVLHDEVAGGPSGWQLWNVSEGIVPASAANQATALLDIWRVDRLIDAVAVPGNTFTSYGPFGVHTDLHVLAPQDTPRHVLKWRTMYRSDPIRRYRESLDLLHLQRTDAGPYRVVIVPRDVTMPFADTDSVADGLLIRITARAGMDLILLSPHARNAAFEGSRLEGTACAILQRDERLILVLGAAGRVEKNGFVLQSTGPVTLEVGDAFLRVTIADDHPTRKVNVGVPIEFVSTTLIGLPRDADGLFVIELEGPSLEMALSP